MNNLQIKGLSLLKEEILYNRDRIKKVFFMYINTMNY